MYIHVDRGHRVLGVDGSGAPLETCPVLQGECCDAVAKHVTLLML